MTIPDNLRVIRLEAENVKRLTAVVIEPKGATVTITGRNGQGKSSLIDSLAYALGGKALVPDEPIRHGEDSARVSVDLGELVVTRVFTAAGSYLTVTNADGAKYPSPQKLLDGLVGALCFDPTSFAGLDRKARAELLMELVGLDLSEVDAQRQAIYEERTAVNREAKKLRASLEQMPEAPEGTPGEEVSLAELLAEGQRILEHNRQNDLKRKAAKEQEAMVDGGATDLSHAKLEVERIERRLQEAQTTLKSASRNLEIQQGRLEDMRDEASQLEDLDPAEHLKRTEQAEATNQAVRHKRAREEAAAEVASTEADISSLTEKLTHLDERKAEAIAGADYPVEGLTADADGVKFNGVPFEQCSTAEQLRISLEVGWALNPKLRVMLVRQGNDLDDDSLELVRQSAIEHEGQLWIERVHAHPSEAAVVIEDGAVVAAPGGEAVVKEVAHAAK